MCWVITATLAECNAWLYNILSFDYICPFCEVLLKLGKLRTIVQSLMLNFIRWSCFELRQTMLILHEIDFAYFCYTWLIQYWLPPPIIRIMATKHEGRSVGISARLSSRACRKSPKPRWGYPSYWLQASEVLFGVTVGRIRWLIHLGDDALLLEKSVDHPGIIRQ